MNNKGAQVSEDLAPLRKGGIASPLAVWHAWNGFNNKSVIFLHKIYHIQTFRYTHLIDHSMHVIVEMIDNPD